MAKDYWLSWEMSRFDNYYDELKKELLGTPERKRRIKPRPRKKK